MIQLTVTADFPLTIIESNALSGQIETPLNVGDKVTIYQKAPIDIAKGIDLKWNIPLLITKGEYTEKDTQPNIILKEINQNYIVEIFNADGSDKYPFERSLKTYVFGMIEDQNRILVEYFKTENIIPAANMEIVAI